MPNIRHIVSKNTRYAEGDIARIVLNRDEFSLLQRAINLLEASGKAPELFQPVADQQGSAPAGGFFAVWEGQAYWIDRPTIHEALDVTQLGHDVASKRAGVVPLGKTELNDGFYFKNPVPSSIKQTAKAA